MDAPWVKDASPTEPTLEEAVSFIQALQKENARLLRDNKRLWKSQEEMGDRYTELTIALQDFVLYDDARLQVEPDYHRHDGYRAKLYEAAKITLRALEHTSTAPKAGDADEK